jgi:hypothetical protein
MAALIVGINSELCQVSETPDADEPFDVRMRANRFARIRGGARLLLVVDSFL